MALDARAIADRLRARFGGGIVAVQLEALDPWAEVAPGAVLEICRYLRDDPELCFDMLHCITAVDYLWTDPKKAAEYAPHFEMMYHMSSMAHRHRFLLKATLPRWKDDVPGQLPEIPSVGSVWNTARWHECEVFDLSGVRFIGHPELRRILCPEDWEGHALRRDYVMPREYHGIRGR
jgi:NADH-quinone oxidoreductase subunit C